MNPGGIASKTLAVELMGKYSNIIFIRDNSIVDAIRRIPASLSRRRQVLPGRPYLHPPARDGVNLLDITTETFLTKLCSVKNGLLTKAIIDVSVGIGPLTAKELVWRAGLPADIKIDQLDTADFASLAEAVQDLVSPLRNGSIQPAVVVDDQDSLIALAAYPLEHLNGYKTCFFPTMNEAVIFALGLDKIRRLPGKDVLEKVLSAELARLQRKITTLKQESDEALSAETWRQLADIIMANVYQIPKGVNQVKLPNLYDSHGDDSYVTIELDPLLTPVENAQSLYAKYNKLKRAQKLVAAQLQQCRQELAYLESIQLSLNQATSSLEIAEIRQELAAAGYLPQDSRNRRQVPASSTPLTGTTRGGFKFIAGKNNTQNDLVTFKVARPDDIWLHAKDIPGAHVILQCHGEEPADLDLWEAAQVAAYFSKGRQSSNVPVDFTRRRHVKKPAGAKPGFVIYEHQKTLYVTPDENLVTSLIDDK
ncbi:protein of unknown function DUF814 [Thermosinus carboxydivorans Nor1]|uniref:NFACT RNA-binding domain-containing protein n=1 Tax=Thermosinus carboxydivorans Nor1 TaxID=401526 RepID=A1HMZ0_9FIRM|nr:NFACT family protein [Thermosinus carboxydivorans]EAX48621.1 protein of unknown function DUF814 [Thermosinus carboxydivorans Nor1]